MNQGKKRTRVLGHTRGGGRVTEDVIDAEPDDQIVSGSAPAPTEPVAAQKGDCCEVMTMALAHAQNAAMSDRGRPGLAQAFVFSRVSGKHTSSPVVYVIPGSGRGKARVPSKNLLIRFCPFCGAEHNRDREG